MPVQWEGLEDLIRYVHERVLDILTSGSTKEQETKISYNIYKSDETKTHLTIETSFKQLLHFNGSEQVASTDACFVSKWKKGKPAFGKQCCSRKCFTTID
jgi:hypothetical protein